MTRDTAGTHRLGFHEGQVLHRLANTYQTLLLTAVEAAQNAIDACAERVFIGIDQRGSQVVVLDDGIGVTQEKFQEALMSVGQGIKKRGSLGRFGLGLISPLNKCERFVFTSQPVGTQTANQWTFVGEAIRVQHQAVSIPFRQLRSMPVIPHPFRTQARRLSTQWRTMVQLVKVTQDRAISVIDIDELEEHIRSKLGQEMRRKGTTVYVVIYDGQGQTTDREINALDYSGEPLEVIIYDDEPYTGRVTFELYRAPKSGGKRKGEVVVMQTGDNYPIRWQEFQVQAMGSGWLADVKEPFDALGSGYFEGVIRIENVELAPERNKFILNDALKASYIAIYRWFEDHGRKHFENEREARREARYQQLGEQSLQRLYALLESNAALAAIFPELTTTTPPPKPRDEGASKEEKTKQRSRVVATHPKARPAKETREQTKRAPRPALLSYAYEMLPDSGTLWDFDPYTATLTLNIRHSVWMALDPADRKRSTARHDQQLMHLQEWLTLKVLLLYAAHSDPDEFEAHRWAVDQEVKPYVAMFV